MPIVSAVRRSLGLKVSLKLALLVMGLTALAAIVIVTTQTRQLQELTLEKAKVAAALGARQYGDFFDNAIDSGVLTVADVFDRAYVEIKGFDFKDKPKFHTRYDALTDRAVLVFQDKLMQQGGFVYAVGVDENGYLPTHNSVYQKPVTGDAARDYVGNRTKRLFNGVTELNAARNKDPSLVQVYARDTGEKLWDVSAPIFVKGKHWGGFRVGVSMVQIAEHQREILLTLAGVFAVFGLITVGAIFILVQIAMRPVVNLTEAAQQISVGEALDVPIKPTTEDEIGQLTRTIDRLRLSMKAAMERLGN